MTYPVYIIFGVLPSFIWLLFYLKKDSHPESNKMVLKIFIYGMLSALPAIFLEFGFFEITNNLSKLLPLKLEPAFLASVLNLFIGVAFVEEYLKYLVVKEKALSHSECDEPLDIMLYMVVAGLGFAALENVLVLFSLGPEVLLKEAMVISLLRFLGATFLHTLSSAFLGFFLAISFGVYKKKRIIFFLFGLGIATVLHGFYNFFIMKLDSQGETALFIPILILIGLAVFMTWGFKKLKTIKSICKT